MNINTISENGLNLIKEFEGCILQAYDDYDGHILVAGEKAKNCVTIGYGITNYDQCITNTKIEAGLTITQETAEKWLIESINQLYCPLVSKYNEIYHFSQNQFDALVSFAYNIGSIDKLTNNGKRSIEEISNAFSEYNKSAGRVLEGLTRRREVEKKLFNTPDNLKEMADVIINDAVSFALKMAKDNSHGYSQAKRSLYNISNPTSFDCSSLVLTSYYYAFTNHKLIKEAEYLKANCSYTGNMLNMKNCGFEIVAKNQTAHACLEKGDIELNQTYHTVLATDKNNIVHARSSEGTTDTVDNSGNEIRTEKWYLYSKGWTHRLRFTGYNVDWSQFVYSLNASNSSSQSKPSNVSKKDIEKKELVKNGQIHLNNFTGLNIKIDGEVGNETKKALSWALQMALNMDFKTKLKIDGEIGTASKKVMKKYPIKLGFYGVIITILEVSLMLHGYDVELKNPDKFSEKLLNAVKQYQKQNNLTVDGEVGVNTWTSLLFL